MISPSWVKYQLFPFKEPLALRKSIYADDKIYSIRYNVKNKVWQFDTHD